MNAEELKSKLKDIDPNARFVVESETARAEVAHILEQAGLSNEIIVRPHQRRSLLYSHPSALMAIAGALGMPDPLAPLGHQMLDFERKRKEIPPTPTRPKPPEGFSAWSDFYMDRAEKKRRSRAARKNKAP